MSALTDESMRPVRATPSPEQAEKLRKSAEKVLGRKLPPSKAERAKKSA
ncbi:MULTISPECIES: hypothetical protein [Nocardia]|uniref:Uncharacterized protein n=1 Tax=Nocardia coubleae TaxID=356147 RepID=A0A846WE00_9NOCA|nr:MULTISPECIES: hypothetical protein [Nocardia]NKX90787.1 hypothetical protein [Nocardia coubleae]